MPSRSIIRTGVGPHREPGNPSRLWRRRSISSPRERLAFSRDENSVDPSARSSVTPPQTIDSIVCRGALRALSSASITRPQRSYGPLRLPSDPPPVRRGGCQPQSRRVSPDDPHHPSNVPCPVPRRIETGAWVDCFPAHTAFPVSQAGRHPHLHFRGLLRLHARYGPLDCSTAQGGLCHEASTRPVARPGRSSATGAIDNSLGGTFLHW